MRLRVVDPSSRTCFRLAKWATSCQPIPYGAYVVLMERSYEKPRRIHPMEQFVGAIASSSRLNRNGTLKHDYPAKEWRLVPLGHQN